MVFSLVTPMEEISAPTPQIRAPTAQAGEAMCWHFLMIIILKTDLPSVVWFQMKKGQPVKSFMEEKTLRETVTGHRYPQQLLMPMKPITFTILTLKAGQDGLPIIRACINLLMTV